MDSHYKHYISQNNPNAAVIELPEKVLGGVEALDFSSLVDKYSFEALDSIIVDLKSVTLINSSGLGMLVAAIGKTKKHGKRLFLCSVPDKVQALLKITHLDEVFTIIEEQQK